LGGEHPKNQKRTEQSREDSQLELNLLKIYEVIYILNPKEIQKLFQTSPLKRARKSRGKSF
jgi:hypothetical protein